MCTIECSIIVPFHINVNQLEYCLRGLLLNDLADSEIIVVGHGVPSINEYIKDHRIKIVKLEHAVPYPTAINNAVNHSVGNLLFFLDQDTYVHENWFENILKFYNRKKCEDSIGVASSKLICPSSGNIIDFGIAFTQYNSPHPWRGCRADFDITNQNHKVQAACSAAMLIDRNLFLSVGGFDEELPFAYCDVDLCLKLKEVGYYTWVVSDAKAYHFNAFPKLSKYFYKEDTKALFSIRNHHRIEHDISKYLYANYQFYASRHQIQNSYFLIDMATILDRSWYLDFITQKLEFNILDRISIPYSQRDSSEVCLYSALSWSVLRKKCPILFFVDSMNSLLNNDLWFNCRDCDADLVVDRNGNVLAIQDLCK